MADQFPLEAILLKDPAVAGAVMFGRGRVQNGILVEPKETFDPRDERRLAEFRNMIWYDEFIPRHMCQPSFFVAQAFD